MITFQEFLSLAESSSPERGSKLLPSSGPATTAYGRRRQRVKNTTKSALQKAGFKRSPSKKMNTKYGESENSDHHETTITTHKNQSDYAAKNMGNKRQTTPKGEKIVSTNKLARKAKAIRKQMGGDRTSKPVHDVDIYSRDDDFEKNDPTKLISRGKSFKREIRAVPKSLKNAGAKPGDKVSSTPMGIMPGEDAETGAKKRAKLYAKELGAKISHKTRKASGTVRG